MYPFPSINQFRNVVQTVRNRAQYLGNDDVTGEALFNRAAKAPTMLFQGTVKLHGTNAAVVFQADSTMFQSRERVLSLTADNAGFYAHMARMEVAPVLVNIKDAIERQYELTVTPDSVIAVYGEWCGGSIQKNVAIAGLPKMFVIFALKFNDTWLDANKFVLPTNSVNIHSIFYYPTWYMSIDFEKPEMSQNMLAHNTNIVEGCCPVGAAFGVEGIGEGIVWQCVDDPSSDYWFKVKGEKHSASKVKTLATVDVHAVETLRDFIEEVVTPQRMQQGLNNILNEKMLPFAMTSMGDFIRWVQADVIKEESDTILASNIEVKKIGGPLALVCRRWFIEQLDAEVMSA